MVGTEFAAVSALPFLGVAFVLMIPIIFVQSRRLIGAVGLSSIFRPVSSNGAVTFACGFRMVRPKGWGESMPLAKLFVSNDQLAVLGKVVDLEFIKGAVRVERLPIRMRSQQFRLSSEKFDVIVYVRLRTDVAAKLVECGWFEE